MKKLYLFTSRVSTTLHSKLAKHSSISGGATQEAGFGVRPKCSNLSTSRPLVLPQPTTCLASSTEGMLMTHSRVDFKAANEKLRPLSTQPIRGGSNSIMVSHDKVMMFGRPLAAVVTSTTGPGSSRP